MHVRVQVQDAVLTVKDLMAELDGLRSQLESSRSAGTDSQVRKRVEREGKREGG